MSGNFFRKYVAFFSIISLYALPAFADYKKPVLTPTNLERRMAESDNISVALKRACDNPCSYSTQDNELYSNFRYTPLTGFDYSNGDGTISRRDPSKVIIENGKYYVWYTKRHTKSPPQGAEKCSDEIPSCDWDLSEIWYAVSEDGFTWKEIGVAVPRAKAGHIGSRSVCTPDILKWNNKFFLFYQAYEVASGTSGNIDECPVTLSYSDSPDGPWTPIDRVVIPKGKGDAWDKNAIHDPYPLIHDGKIYVYYKSASHCPKRFVSQGVAIANSPFSEFKKHLKNPLTNSGHETAYFPFKEGVVAFIDCDGNEHYSIQYAKDWINFELASVTAFMPAAAGPCVPDAFLDNKNGRGITWGLSHFTGVGKKNHNHSILARFDCDLSLDYNDPSLKSTYLGIPMEVYFSRGLSGGQRKNIDEQSRLQLEKYSK